MRSLILHTAIADALGECFQLLAQSLKAVLIEAVERRMVPLRNSLDHFGARRVLVVVVVDNNASIQCDLSRLLFGICDASTVLVLYTNNEMLQISSPLPSKETSAYLWFQTLLVPWRVGV